MSNYQPIPPPGPPPPPPTGPAQGPAPKPRRPHTALIASFIGVACLFAGCGIGTAIGNSGGASENLSADQPAVTATTTATATVTATETKTARARSEPAATETVTVTASPPPPTHAAKPKPPAPRVLLVESGSGIKKTKPYHVTKDSYTIHYRFDCSNFGSQGNFAVTIYDGTMLEDVAVNELAKSGKDTTQEYGSGSHHLEINSECEWRVKVTQ